MLANVKQPKKRHQNDDFGKDYPLGVRVRRRDDHGAGAEAVQRRLLAPQYHAASGDFEVPVLPPGTRSTPATLIGARRISAGSDAVNQ